METKNLKKEDLIKLKTLIEEQLKVIEEAEKKVFDDNRMFRDFGTNKYVTIYYIHFFGEKIYEQSIGKIIFDEYKKDSTHLTYALRKGNDFICGSAVNKNLLDKNYFLSEFGSGSMYFITMEPDTWRTDILKAANDLIKNEEAVFNKEMHEFRIRIETIVKEN